MCCYGYSLIVSVAQTRLLTLHCQSGWWSLLGGSNFYVCDKILWCDHLNYISLEVLHVELFALKIFYNWKWNLGFSSNLPLVAFGSERVNDEQSICYFPKAGHILEFVYGICKKSLSLLLRILLYLVEACPVLMQEKFARYGTVIEPFSICELDLFFSLIDSILPNDQLCKLSDFCCETHSLKDIM